MASTILFSACTASGSVVTYIGFDLSAGVSDPRPNANAAAASFDSAVAALGTVSTITFESAPLGHFNNLEIAPGVFADGVSGLGIPPHTPQEIRNTSFCAEVLCGGNTTAAGSRFLSIEGGFVTLTFTNPIHAFGAFISGLQYVNEIRFNDGTPRTVAMPGLGPSQPGLAFVGFVDAGASITSLKIDAEVLGGDFIGVDDARLVTEATTPPSPVPEPGSVAFIFLAAAALGFHVSACRVGRDRGK